MQEVAAAQAAPRGAPGRRPAGAPGVTLADRAYAALRERILDLRLLPAQLIVEPELAAELGMSRTPVREGLLRLRSEGLVAPTGRRGFAVTVPSAEAMREVYEITAGIEGQAVKLAALRAGPAAIAHLEDSLAAQEVALAADDRVAWSQADRRFHRLLREAAGNRRLLDLMRQLDGQLHRARVATIHLRPRPDASTQEHRAVLEAIKARDAGRAHLLHVAHRERADQAMLDALRDVSGLVLRSLASAGAQE